MKLYIKTIDNKPVIKSLKNIIIRKDGMQTINPSEELVLADGWVEYVTPVYEPTEAELIERAREHKLHELHNYDESGEVNNCVIVYQGETINYWANKYERDVLKSTLADFITMGRYTYRLDLRDKGISITLPCDTLLLMLAALEVYAADCYNKTTDHEYAIKCLHTKEDIDMYEFKYNGYPKMLTFEI